jgi:hypothetical protein
MKWIKTYEAAVNTVRNEKLKLLKKRVNSVLPSVEEVNNKLSIIFNKEFNDKFKQLVA